MIRVTPETLGLRVLEVPWGVNWLNAKLEGKLFTFFFQNSASNRQIIKYVKKY